MKIRRSLFITAMKKFSLNRTYLQIKVGTQFHILLERALPLLSSYLPHSLNFSCHFTSSLHPYFLLFSASCPCFSLRLFFLLFHSAVFASLHFTSLLFPSPFTSLPFTSIQIASLFTSLPFISILNRFAFHVSSIHFHPNPFASLLSFIPKITLLQFQKQRLAFQHINNSRVLYISNPQFSPLALCNFCP